MGAHSHPYQTPKTGSFLNTQLRHMANTHRSVLTPPKRGVSALTVKIFNGVTPHYSGAIVPTEGIGHAFRRPDSIDESDLTHGSEASRQAALGGCITSPLELPMEMLAESDTEFTTSRDQKSRTTRAMGMGIRDEMGGFAPRSEWARSNILKSLTLALRKG